MGATQFICPNKDKVSIAQCLSLCPHHIRCMGKPILEAVANSVKDRGLGRKYSVTELIGGTRELYLKKTTDYAVDPQDQIFAMHGSSIHSICERSSSPDVLIEIRLSNELYTGQIDAYGNLLGNGRKILMDYKVTSSYKASLAMGYYKVDELTGELYKTGTKKGMPKTRKVLKTDGVRKILSWAIQVNAYRMLLEEHNFRVDDMYIQLYVRDYSLRIAAERNIDKPVYLLKVNKISDEYLKRYFGVKKALIDYAIDSGNIPGFCRKTEMWNGRKCEGYCAAYEACKKAAESSITAKKDLPVVA